MATSGSANSGSHQQYTISELAAWCNAAVHGHPGRRVERFEIDSRSCGPGSVFVALRGEHRDGHEFVADAFERGAIGAIVAREHAERTAVQPVATDRSLLAVEDPLTALQQLARRHLERFPDLVRIAVTGSNGKTTTKELIAAILEREAPTFRTAGNYNSEIGVPLAAFAVDESHRYAVFECAMNHPGEIALLAEIVKPSVAVITNIAAAHIGYLGSIEAIANEKKAIFSRFTGSERGFVYEDDPFFEHLHTGVNGTVEAFGKRSTPGFEGYRGEGILGNSIRWRGRSIRLALPGDHNVLNALAAISVTSYLGCRAEAVAVGLQHSTALFGRSQVLRVRRAGGELTVLQDCYNANQRSMEAAIGMLDETEWPGRKLLVLGEMRELGSYSALHHREVLERAVNSSADAVLLFGEGFADELGASGGPPVQAVEASAPVWSADHGRVKATVDFEMLRAWVGELAGAGDLMLLKGSRGVELERLIETLGEDSV